MFVVLSRGSVNCNDLLTFSGESASVIFRRIALSQ